VVSSLGAFNQFAVNALENILETKSKKTISIWGRIVTASLKGSFDIWLKKWMNIICTKKEVLTLTEKLQNLKMMI
jgi:hypothetical protein